MGSNRLSGSSPFAGDPQRLADAVEALRGMDMTVSIFLDPDPAQIDAAVKIRADQIEINTA
ncbi:MAG: pyridoxine 5'-phosphate synthase, partial [SAR324 cluster bacterium]|nr:pyridoxine 5'-phosphate synthase [SAR324 cluster bacterium]